MADLSISVISDQASESNQAGWWHPLDSFQGLEYYGLCKEGGTSGKHQVEIVRRDADGTLTRGLCKNTDGTTAEYDNDVGHNQPSVVVDGAGYIHVFTSMHVNLLRYFRSARPGDVSQMVDATLDFPDVDWVWTYPIVSRGPDGAVYCMMRVANRSTIGETKRSGILYRYDIGSQLWSRYAHAAETENRSVYPDDMSAQADGLHLIFEWAPYPSAAVRHVGEYGVIGTDGLMRTIDGVQLNMPITQGQAAYKSLQPDENPVSGTGLAAGIQSAKFAMNGGSLSHITYRFRTEDDPEGTWFSKFRVFVATWSGSAWVEDELAYVPPEIGDTSAALAATVQGGKRRVYFSVEYFSSGNAVAVIVLAENAGSGWVYSILGNSAPTLLRLGIAPGNGGDVLYVSAPYEARVYRYFVPENYMPAQTFSSFEALLETLT
ncbi:BNR-4 repeat-containing protein [Klebsiella huaxiensis]|uniref:BNR-4 repeat-containing protein n=1 Tax=Klebsiella huaxiensis TaxID=2153354 RepID=A0ABT6EGW0_9ENTR|nr:BNR-4 repeat-containing protein [Klebsiella huaxiensis]MDG1643470.1 BNR-4 repeat-containing protein [Klebsiella huaxiensis]